MNTAFDPTRLKVAVTRGVAEVNELEAENIRRAVARHIFAPPESFDLSFLLQLHRDMFSDVWDWAGVLRTHDLNIGLNWNLVETALFDTTLDLPYWKEQPLVEQCARLHHRLVFIHPFVNGNGRWSRFAADIWSVMHGGPPSRWPAEFVGTDSPIRQEYIAALKAADKNDLSPLIDLHARYAGVRVG